MNTIMTNLPSEQLPAGLHARPGRLSDYLSAFDLRNTFSRHIHGRNDLNDPELVYLDWTNSGFNPEIDICTIFDDQGNLVGFAETWINQIPPVHPWNWVCVHPDYLNTDLHRYLLTWAENRSQSALQMVSPDLRVASRTGIDHSCTAIIQSIQGLGYHHLRSFYRMEIEFDAPPQFPLAPDGFHFIFVHSTLKQRQNWFTRHLWTPSRTTLALLSNLMNMVLLNSNIT